MEARIIKKHLLGIVWLMLFAEGVLSSAIAEVTLSEPRRVISSEAADVYVLSPTISFTGEQNLDKLPGLVAGDNHAAMDAARGESESFVLAIHPDVDLREVRVEISSFIGPDKRGLTSDQWSVKRALTVRVSEQGKWYGMGAYQVGDIFDPLIKSDSYDMVKGVNHLLLVTVRVPSDITPGEYTGEIRVTTGNGDLAVVKGSIRIWDFELPLYPSLITHSSELESNDRGWKRMREEGVQWLKYGTGRIRTRYDSATGKLNIDTTDYEKDVRVLFETGIESVALPPALLGAQRKMSEDYLSTGIAVGDEAFWPIFDQFMVQMADFYRSRGWEDRVYLYAVDELYPDQYPLLAKVLRRAKSRFPELKILTVQDKLEGGLVSLVDIWVVPWHFFVTTSEDIAYWDELRASGVELWAYMNSLYTLNGSSTLGAMRIYPIALAKYGYTGNLWWHLGYARHGEGKSIDPWREGVATLINRDRGEKHYGNGYLFYPPQEQEADWASSLRWESYRQGVEEYDWLMVLGERVDAALHDSRSPISSPISTREEVLRWWGGVMAEGFRMQNYHQDASYIHRYRRLLAQEIASVDAKPFGIILGTPEQTAITTSSVWQLKGYTDPETRVLTNGHSLPKNIAADGTFTCEVQLEPGRNDLVFTFENSNGDSKSFRREIFRHPPEQIIKQG